MDVPATSLPLLIEWTPTEAQLGAERLHSSGRDADLLLASPGRRASATA
ncbi:hypothetical protein [Streptomyces sp. NPDC050585]